MYIVHRYTIKAPVLINYKAGAFEVQKLILKVVNYSDSTEKP